VFALKEAFTPTPDAEEEAEVPRRASTPGSRSPLWCAATPCSLEYMDAGSLFTDVCRLRRPRGAPWGSPTCTRPDLWGTGLTVLELFLRRPPIVVDAEEPTDEDWREVICDREPPSVPEVHGGVAGAARVRGRMACTRIRRGMSGDAPAQAPSAVMWRRPAKRCEASSWRLCRCSV
jgi:hypothetical protein